MLDVLNKAVTPLSIENYTLLDNCENDSLFYGIVLRNEFDTQRVDIKKNFSPKKFYTIAKYNDGFEVLYFYGSFIKILPKYKELIQSLNSFNSIKEHSINNYEKILSLYKLSCSDSYRFFAKGIYPINSDYRESLFSKKNNFHNFFKAKKDLPFFLTIVSPVILYFSNMDNNINDFKKYLLLNTKF